MNPLCFMVYVRKKTIHIHINPYESTMFHGLCPKKKKNIHIHINPYESIMFHGLCPKKKKKKTYTSI